VVLPVLKNITKKSADAIFRKVFGQFFLTKLFLTFPKILTDIPNTFLTAEKFLTFPSFP